MFDFNKATKNVGGWLTEVEGLFLYNTAKKLKNDQAIVEVGSWKGRSTICLGSGSRDGNKVKIFAIDPHIGSPRYQKKFGEVDTFKKFQQNILEAGVTEYVEPIRDTSKTVAKNFDRKIYFVFIDGAHRYSLVKLDFTLWFPKVMNGGILAFHDSWHFIGPNLATAIPLLFSSKIKNPKLVDSITYFEKVERNSLSDRLKNVVFVFYRTFFGVGGCLKLLFRGRNVI